MGNRATVGAFPPFNSRYWRNPAHFRPEQSLPFLHGKKACNRNVTEPLPQVICGDVYHFRTPSPGGQRMSQDVMLPTFFLLQRAEIGPDIAGYNPCEPIRRQPRATPLAFRRCDAHSSGSHLRALIRPDVWHTKKVSNKGRSICVSKPLFSSPPLPLGWRRVVTRSVSRLFSVAPRAASEVQYLVATQLPVQPSVLVQTSFIATDTPAAVKFFPRLARGFRSHAERRLVFGQGGVLRSRTQRSEAPCSRNS